MNLAEVLRDLELDWEYEFPLARPGRPQLLGSSLRSRWTGYATAGSLRQDLADYLSEESRTLVGQPKPRRFAELDRPELASTDSKPASSGSPSLNPDRRMKLFPPARRLFRILLVVIRYRLDDILDLPMPWRLRAPAFCCPGAGYRDATELSRGAPAPGTGRTGPIFIKFRADPLHPPRPAAAGYRRRAGDAAGPRAALRFSCRLHLIERQLGAPVEEFARFDSKPLASARWRPARGQAAQRRGSGGQGGAPEPPIISQDLAWLFLLANTAERPPPSPSSAPGRSGRRLRQDHLRRADLLREAANASQLRRNSGLTAAYVPRSIGTCAARRCW